MATNKHARLRYEALDKCLSNFSRKYFIEDLHEACCSYLENELGEPISISRRQLYADLTTMKNSLSMQAPIEAYWDGNRKYYRYSKEGFSIVDLTDEELLELETTVRMITSFKGMPQFDWMWDIISKLKKKYKCKGTDKTVLLFDSNVDLKGINRFKELFGYIVNEQTITITYEPFNKPSSNLTIHPYYLKQYNNRWFLLGLTEGHEQLSVYPIDRIIDIRLSKTDFRKNNVLIDPDDFFYDVIGVTVPKESIVEEVKLRFSEHRFPYIVAKPIHPSMHIYKEDRIVTVNVKLNKELVSLILSYGKDVEVLSPKALREQIVDIIEENCKIYGLLKDDCKSPM